MVKERISARDLADMITAKISASGLEIVVRRDHAYGWLPNVVAAPGDLIGYQRRARRNRQSAARPVRIEGLKPGRTPPVMPVA